MWVTAVLTADNGVVNGGGQQRGQQCWTQKTLEGKGLTAPPLHPLPFVIAMSPSRLELTLAINSKGLVQRQQRGSRRGEKIGVTYQRDKRVGVGGMQNGGK
jgi:hypothetical protein